MLNPEELDQYKMQLQAKGVAVNAELIAMRDESKPVSLDLPIGRLTRQEALQQQQMALEQKRRMELQKTQIQTALDRVAAGTFGVCVLCKEAIDPRRLEIMPESPICMACQKKRK